MLHLINFRCSLCYFDTFIYSNSISMEAIVIMYHYIIYILSVFIILCIRSLWLTATYSAITFTRKRREVTGSSRLPFFQLRSHKGKSVPPCLHSSECAVADTALAWNMWASWTITEARVIDVLTWLPRSRGHLKHRAWDWKTVVSQRKIEGLGCKEVGRDVGKAKQ